MFLFCLNNTTKAIPALTINPPTHAPKLIKLLIYNSVIKTELAQLGIRPIIHDARGANHFPVNKKFLIVKLLSPMKELALKYGCNPNQKPSRVYMEEGELPIEVLCGRPGYINLLDALNSWQLVKELKAATGMPSAPRARA